MISPLDDPAIVPVQLTVRSCVPELVVMGARSWDSIMAQLQADAEREAAARYPAFGLRLLSIYEPAETPYLPHQPGLIYATWQVSLSPGA